ncbi:hypothetical protein NBRC116494_30240 [Aurantivibrio plasticivorans]
MKIEIPDLVAKASGLNEQELRASLAVKLYDDEKITLGQGSQLAGISQDEFLDVLIRHGVNLKYESKDLGDDIENLKDFYSSKHGLILIALNGIKSIATSINQARIFSSFPKYFYICQPKQLSFPLKFLA